jgi:hypothetical protein
MSLHSTGKDRRYFPRVNYRANATLIVDKKRWPVHILDLSFNGALAALIHKHDISRGVDVVLIIELEDDGGEIKLKGNLAHQKEHFLGIECRATGIDNQAKLRELLEKNKPVDDSYMDRSLSNMLANHEKNSEE